MSTRRASDMRQSWFEMLLRVGARPESKSRCDRDLFDDTFAIVAGRHQRYLVHNRTPQRIRIVDRVHGELVLPPLAQRVISGSRLAPFRNALRVPRQRHQVRVRQYHRPQRCSRVATIGIWLAVVTFLSIVVHDLSKEGTLERREVLVSGAVVVALIVGVLGTAAFSEWRRRDTEEIADAEEGDIEFGMGGAFYDGNETMRRTKHIFTLVILVAIGAVLPAIAIFVGTDAKDFLVMEGGLDVVNDSESRLVGRTIQILYTAALSLFPAILYFQFDRHRIGTIRAEWVRAIFRMDKRMDTLADVYTRYGDELGEASSYSTDSVRLLGGRNSPIIVATLLISLGWTLLIAQTGSFDFTDGSAGGAADQPYFEFLVPTPSAAAMAFLGAYFFGVYLLLRSYYRGDLRPKIYNQITARLITVVVLAYLIQTLVYDANENRVVWALSFLAGVVPTTVLRQLGRLTSSFGARFTRKPWFDRAFAEAFATPRALTQLDGVDLHDSTRLETEGITDIPSLAKADLVSVMVSTRIPVDRLVDWIDQAVLILLLDDATGELSPRVGELRRLGIRTASAVLAASDLALGQQLYDAADRVIARAGQGDGAAASTPRTGPSLASLAAEIRREPAMVRILQWYESAGGAVHKACPTITIDTDTVPAPAPTALLSGTHVSGNGGRSHAATNTDG